MVGSVIMISVGSGSGSEEDEDKSAGTQGVSELEAEENLATTMCLALLSGMIISFDTVNF